MQKASEDFHWDKERSNAGPSRCEGCEAFLLLRTPSTGERPIRRDWEILRNLQISAEGEQKVMKGAAQNGRATPPTTTCHCRQDPTRVMPPSDVQERRLK